MTSGDSRPTNVRFLVVGITALAAMWMYIDRVCFSTLSKAVGEDLQIAEDEMSWVLGLFFFTYALFQIPIGSLADRFGPRIVLTVAIAAWSVCTAATAFAGGVASLIAVRLALGACEAGAYPAAAGLVRRWASAAERGRLSSAVAFGGRIGGALAPILTAAIAVAVAIPGVWGFVSADRANWRMVFLLYGACGLIVAVAFWVFVRDTPAQHPRANAAEAARAAGPAPVTAATVPWFRRLHALATSPNMWLFGATQFLVNVSWIFLITRLPKYLDEVFHVDLDDVGRMQSVPLIASCIGMACGGWFADAMHGRLGPRWGRTVPISLVLFVCAAAYIVATMMSSAWGVIALLSVMAFFVDLGVPSIWAFAQDVGGRQVGAALGWGHMWGNFGAMLSPVVVFAIRDRYGWDVVFYTCAGSFVLAGLAALNLNATVPVLAEDRDRSR